MMADCKYMKYYRPGFSKNLVYFSLASKKFLLTPCNLINTSFGSFHTKLLCHLHNLQGIGFKILKLPDALII